MIIDDIIGFIVSLALFIVEGALAVCIPVANLSLAALEAIIGIFIAGFKLGRIQRKKEMPSSRTATILPIVVLVLFTGTLSWLIFGHHVTQRTVTLFAHDGHPLPFAKLMIHTDDGNQYDRTDHLGKVAIPRFGTRALTIRDARYVEETWESPQIEAKLTATRTVLGASLDSLANQLLQPEKP